MRYKGKELPNLPIFALLSFVSATSVAFLLNTFSSHSDNRLYYIRIDLVRGGTFILKRRILLLTQSRVELPLTESD